MPDRLDFVGWAEEVAFLQREQVRLLRAVPATYDAGDSDLVRDLLAYVEARRRSIRCCDEPIPDRRAH